MYCHSGPENNLTKKKTDYFRHSALPKFSVFGFCLKLET